ncbi:type IV toxin-antitoxin system AbiEi family antitoxin domain-containing protein [Janibacter alkaliphilus]|uniref:Very-short-patch-repair endonuclease n=1 Tax=Janibacter alkaliphilus TaxID=1069963 RepID=A0A852XAZ7_9MICO|nr:hypothetical protein [Janibacter alkaliphilus]NYG35655.1 very-short-patch-repair endonuclease [Janibacter alkaliphilus]
MATSVETLRDLASASGLVLGRRQLREHGWTHKQVRREVRAGRWVVQGQQAVALHNGPLSARGRAVRAVWEVGERVAALDGVSALAWHGLTGYQDERVHVSVPHTARVSAPGDVVLHKVARRAAGEVLARAVPVTAPLWASVRAGHWAVSDRQAALLLVMPVQQRLVDAAALRDLTRQPPGRTRRRHLREIGEAVHGGVESIGELDLGAMCRRHALPPPSRQVVRETPGGRCYLDAFWEEAGFGIEVDGSGHRAGAHVALDHLRTNDLVIGGEPLLRVDLLGLRLYEGRFAAQIRSMLARPRRSR